MHDEAFLWVARFGTAAPLRVLDLGGRDVNGSPRRLFPNATYTVVDARPGPGVDIVADAATWTPELGAVYDVVLCTEVFEHAAAWPMIVDAAYYALAPGGRFVATMAGPGRPAHSAVDGGHLRPGEYYGNVHPDTLRAVLAMVGFLHIEVDRQRNPADTRCSAVR